MGGPHPTLMPQEAGRHADAVVVGEGEGVWPELLRDLAAGRMATRYAAQRPVALETLPPPRYALIRNRGDYAVANGIQAVRGCPHRSHCPFCIVPVLFGDRARLAPIDTVVRQVTDCAGRDAAAGVNLSACCALNHTRYIASLAEALEPLRIRWSGAGLLHMLNDERLLRRLAASGCECIYTESEVTCRRKDAGTFETYREAVARIHANGITVSYNFTVGMDTDTAEVFEDVQAFILETGLRAELCAVQLFAPWPGSDRHAELDRAGRILDRDWSHYDNTHVVFRPLRMSVADLAAATGAKA
jgi:radical SAM superfamily enzyme YgiQ (UPF0313 family)